MSKRHAGAAAAHAGGLAELPANGASHYEQSRDAHRAGAHQAAFASIERAIAADGANPDYQCQRARCLQALGRSDEAVETFRWALAVWPDHAGAHLGLGNALAGLGRHDEAIGQLREAVRLQPTNAQPHYDLGLVFEQKEMAGQAAQSLMQAVAIEPGFALAHYHLGVAFAALERFTESEVAYRVALHLRPNDARIHNDLGVVYMASGDYDKAVASFEAAQRLKPDMAEIHDNLGAALRAAHRAEEAIASFERALALKPDFAGAAAHLAAALEQVHRLDEARAAAERALALAPQDTGAPLVLARLERRAGDLPAARARLRALLQRDLEADRLMAAASELGKVCDSLEAYDEAFGAVSRANGAAAQQPRTQRVPGAPYRAQITRNRDYFTAERSAHWPTQPPEDGHGSPIFFVGFPRSGTTLAEQILGAHPKLVTTDELPLIDQMVEAAPQILEHPARYPEFVGELDEAGVTALRGWYWRALEEALGDTVAGKRVVDKLPLNLIHLGLVRRIFPDAKVIVALRDPRDVCFSCFMQNFAINPAMVHFLNLGQTARLYEAVAGLWLHYREALGLQTFAYRYEDLVEDVAGTARALFAFIEEPWHDGVLRYYETASERRVSTPSYQDVAGPVHARAIGRWRHYRSRLAPILPVLAPFVEAFGYES